MVYLVQCVWDPGRQGRRERGAERDQRKEEGVRSFGAVITGVCGAPGLFSGSGIQTLVLMVV